jgi:Fe-S cluster assembly protein SufD
LSEKKYLQNFRSGSANGWSPQIHQMRESALNTLNSLELPNTHQEEWRFTNLAPMKAIAFQPALPRTSRPPGLMDDVSSRIVVINGRFTRELSNLPKDVEAGSLKEHKGFEHYFGKLTPYDSDLFTAWNTAFFEDVAFIRVPDGSIQKEPMHLIFSNTGEADTASFPRALVILGKQSQATLIESYVGHSKEQYFSGAVTEIHLHEGAVLQHVKIQRESDRSFHIASTQIHQERDSSYSSLTLTLGAGLSRENLGVTLDGIGSDCSLNGLYLIGRNQHTDHHTTIDHAKPHGTSRELYKGILDTGARAVFNGKIIVRKDAQKTDAEQTNKNLLLAEGARVNSTPQLEILADDVKCRHGATIGHLDEEAMFYLRSRGLPESMARTLLLKGFVQDVTARVSSEKIRAELNELLDSRLEQFTGVVV